jgi:hypothetical protein
MFAVTGDFGHIGGVFAGLAAVVLAFGDSTFTGRMRAFLRFCVHLDKPFAMTTCTLMAFNRPPMPAAKCDGAHS